MDPDLLLAASIVGLMVVLVLLTLRMRTQRAQLDRSADLADAMRSTVFRLDALGVIIECNSQATALLGLSRSELVGRPVTDFMPEITPPFERTREIASTAATSGTGKTFLANGRLRRGVRSKDRIFAIVRDIAREEELIASVSASQIMHTIRRRDRGSFAHRSSTDVRRAHHAARARAARLLAITISTIRAEASSSRAKYGVIRPRRSLNSSVMKPTASEPPLSYSNAIAIARMRARRAVAACTSLEDATSFTTTRPPCAAAATTWRHRA